MSSILETKIKRRIDLINLFYSTESDLSMSYISKTLGVSTMTISADVLYLKSTYSDYLSISKDKNNRVAINNTSTGNLNQVKVMLLKQSKQIKILTELLLRPFKTIKDYALIIDASTSSVYKSIEKINISLAPFHIKITTVNNKFFLDSNSEILLRKLFSIFLIETTVDSIEDLIIPSDEFKEFKDYLNSHPFLKINFFHPYYFAYFYISDLRENQNFTIKSLDSIEEKLSDHSIVSQIVNTMTFSPYKDTEIFYNRNFYALQEYLNIISDNNKEKADLFFIIIQRIYVNEISDQIPISLFLNKLNFFYFSLKKKKHIFNSVMKIISDISTIMRIDLSHYHVVLSYLILVHFSSFLTYHPKQTIFIVSRFSKYHSDFFKSFFSNAFDNFYNFIVVTEKEKIKEVDNSMLFITNDSYLEKENKILVNDYPTKTDVKYVKEKIDAFFNEGKDDE